MANSMEKILYFTFLLVVLVAGYQINQQRELENTQFQKSSSAHQLAGRAGGNPLPQNTPLQQNTVLQESATIVEESPTSRDTRTQTQSAGSSPQVASGSAGVSAERQPDREQVLAQTNQIQAEMERQRVLIQELESEKAFQEQRINQMQLNQGSQKYQTEIQNSERLAQLQVQLHEAEASLSETRYRVRQLSGLGYESDMLIAARKQYQSELSRYQQSLSEMRVIQAQAGEAAAASQIEYEQQKNMELERLRNSLQPQINQAKERLRELEQKQQMVAQKNDLYDNTESRS
jgi:hypothetical protein